MNRIFSHSGNCGDVCYSLTFLIELLETIKQPIKDCCFNLQINQRADYSMSNHPWGNVLMTKEAAEYILPLIRTLGFKDVTISESNPTGTNDLSNFRKLRLNTYSGEIRSWYYDLEKFHLPQNFSRKIFDIPKNKVNGISDKLILCFTNRYRNHFINMKSLEQFKDKLLFLGLDSEYESFCKQFFELDRIETKDGLNTAEIFNSAKGVIGNVSGNFAIAEQMKCRRILLTPEFMVLNGAVHLGPVNVLPQGGYFETVRTQEKLPFAVEVLLKK